MSKRNSIIVVGAGRFGSSIACKLNSHNENVVIIDKDHDAFNNLDDFSGYMVVGDALNNEVLEKNGIFDAKCVVLATDSDNVNIYLSDVCSHIYCVPKIYVKLNDSRRSSLLNEGVNYTCPFMLSMNEFDEMYRKGKV